jgi:hypothetical protein
MPERELTIAAVTGLDVDPIHTGLTSAERQKLAASLNEKVRELPLLAPLDLGERLLGVVADALKKPVAGVLEEVWKQRKEMRDAAGKTLGEPAPSSEVELVDHTVDWGVHPTVKVTVNGATATLKLDIIVKLTLDGAKLVIERAHITRFLSGKLTSAMSIKFRDAEIASPYRGTIDLPGEFTLPHGGIDLSGTDDRAPSRSGGSS